MSEVSRVQEPGRKTMPVVWPESAIQGAVARAGDVVAGRPASVEGAAAGIATMDLACLVDVATTFLAAGDPPSAGARPAADYATAYASLHEVVRAFLAGERNTRYLRRLHAEIETELTRPASTSEWGCERCGSPRWAGWRNGPEHEGWPRKAQCVPCGHVQELPSSEVSRG